MEKCSLSIIIVSLVLYITGNSRAELICSKGYHQNKDLGICCKDVICPRDTQFKLCRSDLGEDTCTPCTSGLVNSNVINTRTATYQLNGLCELPDCDCAPEAKLENQEECRNGTKKQCVCDIEKLYIGEDPLNCRKPDATMQRLAERPGFEMLLNGSVRECLEGHFKSRNDSSVCHPHSRCPVMYTVDTPGTKIHDTKCQKNPSTDTPDSTGNSTPSVSVPPTSPSPDSGLKDEQIILITCVSSIAVTGFIVCIFCFRKKWYKKLGYYVNKRDIEQRYQYSPQIPSLDRSEDKERTYKQPELEPLQSSNNGIPSLEDRNSVLPDKVGSSLDLNSLLGKNDDSISRIASNFPAHQAASIPQEINFESRHIPSVTSKDEGIGHSKERLSEFKKPYQIVKPLQGQNGAMQQSFRNHEEDQELTYSKETV